MLKDVKLPVKSRFPEARIIATNRGWAYDNRTPFPIVLNPKQIGLKNKLIAANAPTTLVEYKQFIADNPKVLKGPGLQSAPTPPAVDNTPNTPPTIDKVKTLSDVEVNTPEDKEIPNNATEREGAESHLDDMAKALLKMQKEEEAKKAAAEAEEKKAVKKPKKVKKPKAKN